MAHPPAPTPPQAVQSGPRLVIDLDFDGLMTDSDVRHLAQQLSFSYAANCRVEKPCHLHLLGFKGSIAEISRRVVTGAWQLMVWGWSRRILHAILPQATPQAAPCTLAPPHPPAALNPTRKPGRPPVPGIDNWHVTTSTATYLEHFRGPASAKAPAPDAGAGAGVPSAGTCSGQGPAEAGGGAPSASGSISEAGPAEAGAGEASAGCAPAVVPGSAEAGGGAGEASTSAAVEIRGGGRLVYLTADSTVGFQPHGGGGPGPARAPQGPLAGGRAVRAALTGRP